MIKDVVKNAVFMNGSYEAGYQGGKLVFEIITTVLTGGTGGVKNIITAMKKANTLLRHVVDESAQIATAQADEIARLIVRSFTLLEEALRNSPKLLKWFGSDMPAVIKGRMMDWIDKGIHTHYISRLEVDMGQMSQLKTWLTQKGVDGLDSWRYLEDAFQDRIWCLP